MDFFLESKLIVSVLLIGMHTTIFIGIIDVFEIALSSSFIKIVLLFLYFPPFFLAFFVFVLSCYSTFSC